MERDEVFENFSHLYGVELDCWSCTSLCFIVKQIFMIWIGISENIVLKVSNCYCDRFVLPIINSVGGVLHCRYYIMSGT